MNETKNKKSIVKFNHKKMAQFKCKTDKLLVRLPKNKRLKKKIRMTNNGND